MPLGACWDTTRLGTVVDSGARTQAAGTKGVHLGAGAGRRASASAACGCRWPNCPGTRMPEGTSQPRSMRLYGPWVCHTRCRRVSPRRWPGNCLTSYYPYSVQATIRRTLNVRNYESLVRSTRAYYNRACDHPWRHSPTRQMGRTHSGDETTAAPATATMGTKKTGPAD